VDVAAPVSKGKGKRRVGIIHSAFNADYIGDGYRRDQVAAKKQAHAKPGTVRKSKHKATKPLHKTPRKYGQVDPFYLTHEWRLLRFDTLQRDHFVCRYCGDSANQADHVIPRKKGGPDHLDNLVACCASCNRVAGNHVFPTVMAKGEWIRLHRATA
jgi:5-methylcytosine-specific restriction protein A